MKYDKLSVYTAWDADELKVGSKVILANTMQDLIKKVNSDDPNVVFKLDEIADNTHTNRFIIKSMRDLEYNLAYLISEPKENFLEWTDLKLGDKIQMKDGIEEGIVMQINKSKNTNKHVCCGNWIYDKDLKNWEKVE